jgi:hypothetical protein
MWNQRHTAQLLFTEDIVRLSNSNLKLVNVDFFSTNYSHGHSINDPWGDLLNPIKYLVPTTEVRVCSRIFIVSLASGVC